MKETKFTIIEQGDVEMAHNVGYMLVGGENAVCFYIDPVHIGYVNASSHSENGCPIVYISPENDDYEKDTVIEFSEFKDWQFFAGGGGKSIAISLVKYKN